MKTRLWYLIWAFGLASALLAIRAAELPRLFPDYVGVTVPPNIAPLNFKIQEPGVAYRVSLRSSKGTPITLVSSRPAVRIPPKAWSALLRANPGEPLFWDVAVQTASSQWVSFATVTNAIAREEIDPWLAYRRLQPIFNYYKHLGIYQRNLESFDQKVILEKDSFGEGCLNCHTPMDRRPDTFGFHIRAFEGKSPMIMVRSNQVARVDKTMGYLAWHPAGHFLAFSANKYALLFHTRGETQDVFDSNSDLGIYDLDANTFGFPPAIAATNQNETWPTWSPDGKFLYFSSAAPQPVEKLREVRYDLVRAGFDPQTRQWGQREVMISAAETGLSACQPKVSPDGRFLLVTLCKYGSFPIHQTNSDLAVMELATRKFRRLEINSGYADTWHSWSGNSRWLVFSSKRIDGLLARPHFSYVDEQGVFHKPFVLPQEDPSFYGFCLDTFNVPELMTGPVTVKERDLVRAVVKPRVTITPQGPPRPTPAGTPASPESSGSMNSRE